MFTATAVLQLCEKKKISLDDTLDMYFQEFKYGKDITIAQLLHMQSGLRKDYVTEETFLFENGERNVEEWKRYFYDGFTDEELLSMIYDEELMFEPGTQFLYSNVGYNLLAMIIEKVTDMTYSDYVQENIFDVCDMTHTSSMKIGDVTSVPEYIPGEDAPYEDPYEYVDTLYMQLIKPERGVGDIHSCAYDLLLFDRALIGGDLIGEDSLAEMFNMDMGYGCGWMQFGGAQHPIDGIYYHGGETWVYKGYNMYCKTEKYGNVYLIQLHPTTAGDEYSLECMKNIIMNLKL
jgi:CubicO group peptidase (beta-lactamase class C family)